MLMLCYAIFFRRRYRLPRRFAMLPAFLISRALPFYASAAIDDI